MTEEAKKKLQKLSEECSGIFIDKAGDLSNISTADIELIIETIEQIRVERVRNEVTSL